MSRSTYQPTISYTGANNKSDYTFPFKIEAKTQLLVIEMDAATPPVETQRVDGTDAVYIDATLGVVFDAVAGAGTVNLTANLATGRTLWLILQNDKPTQPNLFRDSFEFTLRNIEKALDFIVGSVMWLAYRAKRSLHLHENDDETTFQTRLPENAPTFVNYALTIGPNGIQLSSPSVVTGLAGTQKADIVDNNAVAAAITGMTVDPTTETTRFFFCEHLRTSTQRVSFLLAIIYDGTNWAIKTIWTSDDHGLSFTMNANQVEYTSDNAGFAARKFKFIGVPVDV